MHVCLWEWAHLFFVWSHDVRHNEAPKWNKKESWLPLCQALLRAARVTERRQELFWKQQKPRCILLIDCSLTFFRCWRKLSRLVALSCVCLHRQHFEHREGNAQLSLQLLNARKLEFWKVYFFLKKHTLANECCLEAAVRHQSGVSAPHLEPELPALLNVQLTTAAGDLWATAAFAFCLQKCVRVYFFGPPAETSKIVLDCV